MKKEKKVKILILTQKVDQNDDVLGFFHGWVKEFAKHCEQTGNVHKRAYMVK